MGDKAATMYREEEEMETSFKEQERIWQEIDGKLKELQRAHEEKNLQTFYNAALRVFLFSGLVGMASSNPDQFIRMFEEATADAVNKLKAVIVAYYREAIAQLEKGMEKRGHQEGGGPK